MTDLSRIVATDSAEGLSDAPESFGQQAWERFRSHKIAIAGADARPGHRAVHFRPNGDPVRLR
ncbi:MAG: hypothetical protein R2706_19465 [Acidimicrobiales bacterium]